MRVISRKTADRLSLEKNWREMGEGLERNVRKISYFQAARQRASVCVCVCVCIPLSIKVSGASYFSSAAADVRTSSAPFPALAPGEFITSPLPATV